LADEQLCERVFINLVQTPGNESAGDGRERILRLSTAESLERQPGVAVTVEDTGQACPEMREQIFNPFLRRKRRRRTGLAIVAKIVDDHHGWIHLNAIPDWKRAFACFPAARK
jgi:nitrogen fixation/metabolism regulation signal transduction histidine kinase